MTSTAYVGIAVICIIGEREVGNWAEIGQQDDFDIVDAGIAGGECAGEKVSGLAVT